MTNQPLQATNQPAPTQLIVDPSDEPFSYADALRQMGMAGEQIPAKELIDRKFTIYRAKQFESSFQDGAHAYFCTIKIPDSADPYTVVLGGGSCVEVIDAYIASGIGRPLQVTLRYAEGQGKFSGYYFFE